MEQTFIHNDTMPAGNLENGKAAWHRPSVSRIDIKRTLAGLTGTNDGLSPSGKTA